MHACLSYNTYTHYRERHMILRSLFFFNTLLNLALGKEVNCGEAAGPVSRVRPETQIAL